MPALALGLLRVEAEHVATAAFPFADDHFLDLEVVGDRLVAAGPGEHLGFDLAQLAQRCRQDVAPETARQRQEIGRRIHPRIADKHAAAEPPGAQILLDPGDGGDIGGVARQHPGSHRHAVAGHCQRDDHLRLVVPPLFIMAAPAQRGIKAATPFGGLFVGGVDLEIGRRRVVEDQIDIEPEQIGRLQKDVALDLFRPRQEEVEGAVELVDAEPLRLRQERDIGQPVGGAGELRAGLFQALRRHREERRFVRRCQPGLFGAAPDSGADAEILPQLPRRQHHAQFEDPLDLDLGERGTAVGDRIAGFEHPVDALDEALEPVAVDPIGATEIVHHPRLGALGRGVPGVLGQGVISDRRAVPITPFGDPKIHAQPIAPIRLLINENIIKSCV